jgi:hypothetical protein
MSGAGAPQVEAPVAARPMPDPLAMPPPSVATAPAGHGHAADPPRKLRAAPQGSEGSRAPVAPERAATRRLAAVPPAGANPGKPAASDAPITVLRGGPRLRSAQTGRPQAQPAEVSITVIRGGRARATGLEGLVQPGPLILRIR